jgi:hypothetical protein
MRRTTNTHSATVTVVLPAHFDSTEEVSALRAAGVPVNDHGEVADGYLFKRWYRQSNRMAFRWFARTPGEASVPAPSKIPAGWHTRRQAGSLAPGA